MVGFRSRRYSLFVQWFFVPDGDDVDDDTHGADRSDVNTRGKEKMRFVVKAKASSVVTSIGLGANKFWLVIWGGKILVGH
jgi:hypothetical protein